MSHWFVGGLLGAAILAGAPFNERGAHADPQAASAARTALPPSSSSASIPILAGGVVGARISAGAVLYGACAAEPCTPSQKDASIPTGTATDVTLRPIALSHGRRLLWAHGAGFDALIAGEDRDGHPVARVIWSGATGLLQGEPGERQGPMLQVGDPANDGTVTVLLGETREDISLCGRPTILSPRLLDPESLGWKNVTVQRLTADERSHAKNLSAVRNDTPTASSPARLLRATGASSAVGSPDALTDGDLESTWAEGRGGDGHGELVQLMVPEQVKLRGLSFVVRPPKREIANGIAPHTIWIATERDLYKVTFADDAWGHAGAAYEVAFPEAIKTRCLAIVLDEAYERAGVKAPEVTIAETIAKTELDGVSDWNALAGALAGGGERARTAEAILAGGGDAAIAATAKAYSLLDDAGKLLALDVLDNAPCDKSAPVYVTAMTSELEGEALHAQDRLRRCGNAGAPALVAALSKGPPKRRSLAAEQLALAAPATAVSAILDAIPAATVAVRSDLRGALAIATRSDRSTSAVAAKLRDEKLAPESTLDLLRSLSGQSGVRPEEPRAFYRASIAGTDFRSKYLLLGPAARLAAGGDARADWYLRTAIRRDSDAHVRARAANVAKGVASAQADLAAALADADPRVRDAAIVSLTPAPPSETESPAPQAPLVTAYFMWLLRADPWTFVRADAVRAMANGPASSEVDNALARALEHDARSEVRARAVEGLGLHGALTFAEKVRDRVEDGEEDIEVRARAARALGRMCDLKSADLLTHLARAATNPVASPGDQLLAVGSIVALGRLKPPDLAERLRPLLAPDGPVIPREAAKAALESKTDVCKR